MEESGHYYTVYFVALAVGFSGKAAKGFAFCAQMPDEVASLDAKELEIRQGGLTARQTMVDTLRKLNIPETLLAKAGVNTNLSTQVATENDWRMLVEQVLHSLTGGDVRKQREITRSAMENVSPKDGIKFGFLLHRLGDTFAHSHIDDETMLYRTDKQMLSQDRGHALHGSAPDHPWQRQHIFMAYVRELYDVLTKALKHPDAKVMRQEGQSLSSGEVEKVFRKAIANIQVCSNKDTLGRAGFRVSAFKKDLSMGLGRPVTLGVSLAKCATPEDKAQAEFAGVIRSEIQKLFKIEADPYQPERNGVMTLAAFLNKYKLSDHQQRRITPSMIEDAVVNISKLLESAERKYDMK